MSLSVGTFDARVVSHRWTSSAAGNVGLNVKVAIADGFGSEEEAWATIWITPKSRGIARAQFNGLGFDINAQEFSELDDEQYLAGRTCKVVVTEEEYKGRTYLKVSFPTNTKPTKKAITQAQRMLRDAEEVAEDAPDPAPPMPPPAPKSEPPARVNVSDTDGSDIPF